jgi:hypothetical protein
MKKLEVLHAKRTTIRINEDISIKVWEKCKQLIPYLQDTQAQGNIIHFQKYKLVINGKKYDLDFLHENYQL